MTIEVTADTFDDTVEQGIVLVEWRAEWCGPCRIFAPIYERAARRHRDIVFARIDVDAEENLAAQFHVQSVPTLMAFCDGILVFSRPGVLPDEALDKLVYKLQALDMTEVRRIATHSAG